MENGVGLDLGGGDVDCDFEFDSMELRNFYLCKKKCDCRSLELYEYDIEPQMSICARKNIAKILDVSDCRF